MGLTQERINEIAVECWNYYLANASVFTVTDTYNHFLSRIREEQESIATVIVYNDAVSISASAGMLSRLKDMHGKPLFTIPPEAPDCKELVEALEKSFVALVRARGDWMLGHYPPQVNKTAHIEYMTAILDDINRVIAKHKSAIGEK